MRTRKRACAHECLHARVPRVCPHVLFEVLCPHVLCPQVLFHAPAPVSAASLQQTQLWSAPVIAYIIADSAVANACYSLYHIRLSHGQSLTAVDRSYIYHYSVPLANRELKHISQYIELICTDMCQQLIFVDMCVKCLCVAHACRTCVRACARACVCACAACMCVCMYTCVNLYVYMRLHVCRGRVHAYARVCACMCACLCGVHVRRAYARVCICVRVCMVCMCACMCACMCGVHVCVYVQCACASCMCSVHVRHGCARARMCVCAV